jgi:hypothetical protein
MGVFYFSRGEACLLRWRADRAAGKFCLYLLGARLGDCALVAELAGGARVARSIPRLRMPELANRVL